MLQWIDVADSGRLFGCTAIRGCPPTAQNGCLSPTVENGRLSSELGCADPVATDGGCHTLILVWEYKRNLW